MDAALARDANTAIAHTVAHFTETTRVILRGELDSEQEAAEIIARLRAQIASGNGTTAAGSRA
jgi:hypothetical protein